MRFSGSKVVLAGIGLIGALLLSGCALRFSGGGEILSTDGIHKAKITINYDALKDKAHGEYQDDAANVRFKVTGIDVAQDQPGYNDNCMGATLNYESQDKDQAGVGSLFLAACDNGQGKDKNTPQDGDSFQIRILTGPYAGYQNQ